MARRADPWAFLPEPEPGWAAWQDINASEDETARLGAAPRGDGAIPPAPRPGGVPLPAAAAPPLVERAFGYFEDAPAEKAADNAPASGTPATAAASPPSAANAPLPGYGLLTDLTVPAGAPAAAIPTAAAAMPSAVVSSSAPPPDAAESASPQTAPSPSPAAPTDPAQPFDPADARLRLGALALGADRLLRQAVPVLAPLLGADREKTRAVFARIGRALRAVLPPELHDSADRDTDDARARVEAEAESAGKARATRAIRRTAEDERADALTDHEAALARGDADAAARAERRIIAAAKLVARAGGADPAAVVRVAAEVAEDLAQRRAQYAQMRRPSAELERLAADDTAPPRDRDAARAILAIRRADPARAGEAEIESHLDRLQRNGAFATDADRHAARLHLRHEAQQARQMQGPPRLYTNAEIAELKAQYAQLPDDESRERFIAEHAARAGELAPMAEAELTGQLSEPPAPRAKMANDTPAGPLQEGNDTVDGDSGPNEADEQSDREKRRIEFLQWYRSTLPSRRKLSLDEKYAESIDAMIRFGVIPDLFAQRLTIWSRGGGNAKEHSERMFELARLAEAMPEEAARVFERERLSVARRIAEFAASGRYKRADTSETNYVALINDAYAAEGDKPDFITPAIANIGEFLGRRARVKLRAPTHSGFIPLVSLNKELGLTTQSKLTMRLKTDFARIGANVRSEVSVVTPKGETRVDLKIEVSGKPISVWIEVKSKGARYRNPQKEKQSYIPELFIMEADADGSNATVRPHPKSPLAEELPRRMTYEEWLDRFRARDDKEQD